MAHYIYNDFYSGKGESILVCEYADLSIKAKKEACESINYQYDNGDEEWRDFDIATLPLQEIENFCFANQLLFGKDGHVYYIEDYENITELSYTTHKSPDQSRVELFSFMDLPTEFSSQDQILALQQMKKLGILEESATLDDAAEKANSLDLLFSRGNGKSFPRSECEEHRHGAIFTPEEFRATIEDRPNDHHQWLWYDGNDLYELDDYNDLYGDSLDKDLIILSREGLSEYGLVEFREGFRNNAPEHYDEAADMASEQPWIMPQNWAVRGEWFKRSISPYQMGVRWAEHTFNKLQSAEQKKVHTDGILYQSAYHGTPHRFSKFTLDHIGTGEGAQAHGYGLYFAMDKEVADGYRERFRGRRKGQLYEVEIPESSVLLDEQKSLQEQPKEVQQALRSVFDTYSEEQLARIKKERLQLVDPRVWSSSEMGRLEVQRDRLAIVFNALRGITEKPIATEIKSPSNPFSRSPLEIYERRVERLRRFYTEEQIAAFQLGTDEWKAEMASMQSKMDEVNKQIFENNKILQEQANAYREKIIKASGVELLEMEDDGSWIYNAVVLAENGDPRMASIRLNEAGIKGITYDGETDGRCFVLFDEKSIEILRTFYQFAGEQGASQLDQAEEATKRMDSLTIARKMEQEGKDATAVKLATGWERGADNFWRYEIDDSGAKYHPEGDANTYRHHPEYVRFQELQIQHINGLLGKASWTEQEEKELIKLTGVWGNEAGRALEQLERGHSVLEDVLIHETLFDAYPILRRMPVRFQENGTSFGSYRGINQGITLAPRRSDEETFKSLMHEVQHAIQEIEGFAAGGNTEAYAAIVHVEETYKRAVSDARELLLAKYAYEHTPEYAEMAQTSFTSPEMQQKLDRLEATLESKKFTPLWDAFHEKYKGFDPLDFGTVNDGKFIPKDSLVAINHALKKIGSSYEFYKKHMGEVEARNVETRLSMTTEARLASLARDTEDIARKDQFFIRRGIYALCMKSDTETMTADQKLAKDVADWEKTVDKFIAGELDPRKPVTMLNSTPLVLSLLDADVNLPVITDYSKLKKILKEKHKLPAEVLKQVPAAMADPIMIFKSATMGGDYVLMLGLKDDVGATVVVPVSLNFEKRIIGGKSIYTVNYISSVYSKKNEASDTPNDSWFKKQIEEGNLRYINHKKSRQWMTSSRLQSPWGGSFTSGKDKIYSEADLVNLKKQLAGYYAGRNNSVMGSYRQFPSSKEFTNGVITFFESADISTAGHEIGHWLRQVLETSAILQDGQGTAFNDWKAACDFVGADLTQSWSREQEEIFADAFVAYLKEGHAPNKFLARAFDCLKNWLTNLYARLTGNELVAVSPEIAHVFDNLLTPEQKEPIVGQHRDVIKERILKATSEVKKPYSEAQAEAYADIVDCTLQAFAQRTGIDYQQVCDRLTPTFVNNQNAMDDPDQYDALLLQPAFHGSSYHFDKFSSKFIGEGSGEQSHGYGLYFSKASKVADDYRKNHSFEPNTIITINGKDYTYSYTYGWMPSASEEERHILDLAEKHKNKETIIKILQRGLNEERNLLSRLHERKDDVLIDRTRQNIASYQKKIDLIKKAENFSVRQTYGQLYEVEIPDDSLLLDEGKTFDAQPEKVQRGLRELGIGQQAPKLATEHDHFVSGRHLYEELVKRHGSPRAASEALASVGIKGITYESEIDGQCFVIFDEKSIEVLKKFYQQRPRSSLLFQSAYHGTPHHFDSFSMDHIGDGEGALAHGWGLYFAQDSEIANKYREELTRQEYYANGMKLEGMDALAAEFMFDSSFYSPATLVTKEEALEQARLYAAGDASYLAELSEVLERLYGMEVEQREPDGQLFQVEIPDDSVLLDEDKTFYEQPEEVQRGLRELGMGQLAPELSIEREVIRQEQLAIYEAVYGEDDFLRSHPWFRPDIYEQDGATPEAVARYEELSKREMELNELENQAEATCFVAGRFLYEELVKKHGSARAASEALASVGIKGITYEGDQDGRCFVLFDEKSIEVLKTFYQRENSVLGSYRQFSASSAFSNGVITFFESADISTAGHEIGHWLRQVLETSAILQDGQGTALNDWKAACDFVGADLTQPWSREQEEIFADAFVAYLKDGHAPNKFLARAFDSLKNWLTNLYARLTGNELVAISPEIAHIFDNLLTPEQQEPIVGQHRDVIKERILEATCNGNLPYMEAQAEAYADIVDCTLQAFAQRTGIDYQQVCDRLTPSFSGQQNALEDPDPVALLLQPAFHGTPHRFETFSMAHIGEGEGAQAHGYGLYFAKQREVGEQYRRRLVNTTFQFTLSGRPLGHWFKTQFESASTAALQQAASGNFELLKENLQPTIEIYREHYTSQKIYYEEMSDIFEKAKNVKRLTVAGFLRDVPEKYKDNFERIANRARKKAKERGHRVKADDFLFEIEDTLGNIKYHADRFYSSLTELENFDWNNLKVIAPQKGQLFEVELPELSEFLDENQPLENQPEIVQAALRKLIGLEILSPEEAGKKVEELRKIVWEMPHKNPREEGYLDYCKPIELGYMYMAMAKSFLTGKAIYKGLARIYGSPRVASEVLNAEGVKGITYDGKQDGRCFVLFDEKSVEVLRTFYQQKPQGSLLYQSAYHGTPHRFEAFSMDHIGAGEGAQTHGYGLYFAQQKDVGEAYRETLVGSAVAYWANGGLWQRSAEGWKNLDSGTVLDPENFVSIALDFKDRYGWTEDAIEFLKIARSFYEEEGIDFQQLKDWQAYNDALKVLEFGKVELGIAGQLFHVQIPEDDVLLDEQLSFDDQPEFVKKGLLRLGFEEPPTKDLYKLEVELEALDTKRWEIFSSVYGEEEFNYWWGDHMAFLPDIFEEQGVATETIERYYELGEQADELRDRVNDLRDQMRDYANGGRIYDKLVDELGTYRDASEALNSVGIKGITYEGRKDGKCFVLFDEKSIKILEKFYQHGQTVLGSYQQFSASPAFSNGVITFFESADISTAGHEIGHWLRQVLETSAILQDGQGTALNDWKAACDFVGADLTQPWSREQEEIFADAFVAYLKEGHAPNKFLARAFDSLKNWLTNLYARLAGNELVAVSPEIAHVFDNLLTPEQQELIVGQHRDAIKEQILTATANGEKPYSEAQAEAYADIVDCTLQAFAQRTGIDYQQVCDRLTPSFSGQRNTLEDPSRSETLLHQSAFHGSAHRFDAFTMQAVGTGEGAQAHGYGLYFAQNIEVGERYRKGLTIGTKDKYEFQINGLGAGRFVSAALNYVATTKALEKASQGDFSLLKKDITRGIESLEYSRKTQESLFDKLYEFYTAVQKISKPSVTAILNEVPKELKYQISKVTDNARKNAKNEGRRLSASDMIAEMKNLLGYRYSTVEELNSTIDDLKGIKIEELTVLSPQVGQLYKVELPDNNVLLDEDLPLSSQTDEVRTALSVLGIDTADKMIQGYEEVEKELEAGLKELGEAHRKAEEWISESMPETTDVLELLDLLEKKEPDEVYKSLIDKTNEIEKRLKVLEQRKALLHGFLSRSEGAPEITGLGIYLALTRAYGSTKAASEKLNEAGIKGITYDGHYDGRCFVLFDEKSVEILKTFYQRGESTKGSYRQFSASSAFSNGVITFFESADISTAGHEIGHWLRQVLETSAILQDGQGTALNDWKAACDFVGADLTQPWSREQEEIFADAFVSYLKEGHAPNKFLARAFDSLKNWLTNLYARLTGNELVAVSPEIAHVFDNLLTPEQQELIVGQHRDAIKEQILTATANGEKPYSEAQAEAYADIVDCTLQAFAQRTGMDYQQVCDRLTPTFSETSKNIEAVRQKFFDSDEWRKAPNGAISNLTETQWMLVRTPEFKSWFGDWEHDAPNASKILDQNGEPRVVYHGTSPIMHFAEFRQSPFGSMGEGSYFTTSKETAEHHSRKYGAEAGQENLYNVFLNIRSPLRLANPYEKHPSDMSIYDGIIADDGNGGLEILAKAASQIKSADRNIGLFSKDNPNIYYQSSKQGDRVMAEAQSDDQQAQAHTLSAGQEAETTKKGIVQTFSEKVALKVIEKLQAGEIPWRKDWNDSELRLPYNPTTNKLYRGGNVFFLMLQDRSDPRWLTYKQAEAMGAQVRKGEKSTPIIFWKTEDYFPKLDENGEPILDEKGKEVKQLCQLERPRPFMSHVFNAEQIDGMPPLQQEELTLKWEPFEVAEEVLANSGADIVYGGNRAFYRINNDRVYLPERERFDSQAGFYSTALHELGHWTGHETRLARDIANTFGSPDYAREELRAELASAVMCMEIGVPNMQLDNNAAYIGGWIKALKNDPREILRAASDAEKIRRFLVEPVLEQRRDRKNEQTIEKEKIEEKTITHYYQPKHTYDAPEERQEVFSFINLSDEEKIDAIIYMQEESMFVEELDGVDPKEIPLESAQAVAESHDLLFTRNGIGFLKDECVAEKEAVRTVTPARTQKEHEGRQYLTVSYKERAEVKKLGAKWDRQEKRWYAPSESIAEKCAKWLKAVEDRKDAQEETRELKKEFTKALAETDRKIDALKRESGDRLYLVVPYKEKNEAKKLGAKWDKVEKSWYADLTAENREELLSRFTQWLPEVSLEQEPAISPTEELQEHLEEMGAIIPEEGIKLDGQEHTLEVRGQEKTITYTATTETPLPSGNIRDENGRAENWTYRGAYIAPESVQALEVQKENHKQELYADIDLKATRAGHTSLQRLASLPKATGKNPYLVKNGICVHEGMREDNGVLVVPMQDICQKSFLTCDLVNETYSFAKGGNAKGKFYVVDDDELSKADVIIAASSVADACIIKEVTGYTTVASVDLGNMATVAKKLHEQYPDKAIIAAAPDINFIMGHNANDILFKSITGIENISVVTPSFGLHNHDFDKQEKNRLSHWSELPQTRFGKDGVKTQIVKAVTQILERVNVKSQVQEQTKKNTQTMSR